MIFYMDTDKKLHFTDATVVAFVYGEPGYYPIYTKCTASQLNEDIPAEIIEAALAGSVAGWDCPAARPAAIYAETGVIDPFLAHLEMAHRAGNI